MQQLTEIPSTDTTWHTEMLAKRRMYAMVLSNCPLKKANLLDRIWRVRQHAFNESFTAKLTLQVL